MREVVAGDTQGHEAGGRTATNGVIAGRLILSVGNPATPAPKGWRWTKLTSVARLETGHTPSRRHPEYWDGDIPWIGIKDAGAHHGGWIEDTLQHVTQAGLDNSSARLLPAHTVCLSRTASIGYVVVMRRPMATSQDFVNWICGEELDYRLLKYALIAEREALLMFAHGTTHQTIYFPEVKAFHICLPPVAEQKSICDVLQAIDDKIERNNRTAVALERLSKALYRAWFVDFAPVTAKAAGESSFVGMPLDVFDSLPNRFVESEIGLVPDGWQVRQIGDVVAIKGGGTPSTGDPVFWDGGKHCWATPKDMSRLTHPVLLDTERHITDAGVDAISSGLLPTGAVLMSSRAPVGYLAVAGVPTAINQGFIAMICDGPLPTPYVYGWADASMELIKARASGTTFPEISKRTFRPLPIIQPTDNVIAAYQQIAAPLCESLVACANENRHLAALRDYLLPRLLSGSTQVRSEDV